MFLPSSTTAQVISSLTEVSSGVFTSLYPYFLIAAGLPLAFWLVRKLVSVMPKR